MLRTGDSAPRRALGSACLPIAFLALLSLGSPASATDTNVWDADDDTAGSQDGAGTWTAGGPNWFNLTLGLDNQTWLDGSHAVFGSGSGAAGLVTLGGPISVANLTFNAAGSGSYTLGGTHSLTLLNSQIVANVAATVTAPLAGSTP